MRKDQFYRALEGCIQSIQSDVDLDAVLQFYPGWGSELRPLLKSAFLAHQLGQAVHLSQATYETERELFLQTAQTLVPPKRASSRRFHWTALSRIGFFIGLLIVLLVGGTFLSESALPGSPLYPFKEFSRQVKLSLPSTPLAHIQSNLSMDQQRIEEIRLLAQEGKEADVSFSGYLDQDQNGDWLLANFKIAQTADTQLVGNIWTGYYVQIDGALQKNGEILAYRLQSRQFPVKGVVETVTSERFTMEGTQILLTPDTFLLGSLMPGARVEVTLMIADGGVYQAQMIKVMDLGSTSETNVQP